MRIHIRWIGAALLALGCCGAVMASERTVIVSGQGEITVEPDRAVVTLGVEARRPDQRAAQREVSDVVRKFLALADELDIAEKNVRSSALQIQPEYNWDNQTRERELIRYFVRRQLEVNLEDLEKLGLIIEQATGLGVNQAQPPQLESSRKDELLREALALAARDARANAEVLARELGAEVGNVRRISTSSLNFQPPPVRPMLERSRAMSADAGGADTYATGEIRFSAQVSAEFDLLVR